MELPFVGEQYGGGGCYDLRGLKKCHLTEENVWLFTRNRMSTGTKLPNAGMYAPFPNSQSPWVN